MTVLVVEDSAEVAERIATVVAEVPRLKVVGHAVDAEGAIAAIRQHRPDAVLLDLRLGRGSGMDVLAAVQERKRAPVMVVLTNHTEPHYRDRCFRLGAHFFLDKSTEFLLLPEILAGLVKLQDLRTTSSEDTEGDI
jgi:DNA-binding NarL/FixJ family response regulator